MFFGLDLNFFFRSFGLDPDLTLNFLSFDLVLADSFFFLWLNSFPFMDLSPA